MLFERQDRATERQLRQFAAAIIVFTLIAVARSWWRYGEPGRLALSLAAVSMAIGVLGAIAPRRIQWLFGAVTAVTLPIGLVVSEAMLAVLYFAVITPMAVVLRAARRDPLDRSIDRQASTYWIRHRGPADESRYFRQS